MIKEIAEQFMVVGSDNDTFTPSKPNTYFYPAGANDYFIDLLKSNEIPHYVDYDERNEIKKISWDIENNRSALEQVLKVQEKIGQTKTPPSIKFLSPEMNDRFEKILEEKGFFALNVRVNTQSMNGKTGLKWKSLKRTFSETNCQETEQIEKKITYRNREEPHSSPSHTTGIPNKRTPQGLGISFRRTGMGL